MLDFSQDDLTPVALFLWQRASLLDLVSIFDNEASTRLLVGPILRARLWALERKTGCLTGWELIA